MSKRIRILSIRDNLFFGGDETRLLAFARNIDRSRFEHTVVTIDRADPELDTRFGTIRQQYTDAGVEVIDLDEGPSKTHPRSRRPRDIAHASMVLFRAVQKLSRLIRKRRIDIVDAHNFTGNIAGVLAGRITNTRTVITLYHVDQWKALLLRLPGQFALNMADAVVTDSQARCNDIKQWMIVPHSRVLVIPSGLFPPSTTRTCSEMKKTLGLPEDAETRVIGQISSLQQYKGHTILVQAACTVLQKEPTSTFLFVGYDKSGQDQDRIEKEIVAAGISDRVRMTSYPGYIGDVWQTIDLHVHASLFDSLPNAIIEGMSLAKPAVVTSVGGVLEMVEHEKTGLVVPPNDPEALSRAILRLLREPETARRLGEAAFKRYEERYQPEVMTTKLENLFEELLR